MWLVCSCSFEGTREELRTHLEQCKFEGLKVYIYSTHSVPTEQIISLLPPSPLPPQGFLSRTDEHITELQEEVKRKEEEIVFLRSMLASLSEKVDQLEKTAIGRIGE